MSKAANWHRVEMATNGQAGHWVKESHPTKEKALRYASYDGCDEAPRTRKCGAGCYEYTSPGGRTEYIVHTDRLGDFELIPYPY